MTVKTVNDALTAMQLKQKKRHLHSLLLPMGPLEVQVARTHPAASWTCRGRVTTCFLR